MSAADLAPPVTTEPRSWTLRAVGGRPMTINRLSSIHRMTWAHHTEMVRRLWWGLAKEAKLPAHLDRVRITVVPLQSSKRWTTDCGAVAPEAKAAIDGLVDAGFLVDDSPDHVLSVLFLPPVIGAFDGLELRLWEAVE